MIKELEGIAREAGNIILKYYKQSFSCKYKNDHSPVTQADLESNSYLIKALLQVLNIPVLSEEAIVPFSTRRNWNRFWLVDPLDGTKEFINGHDEFCINIALIENSKPILGLIYAPALNEFYFASESAGFVYQGAARSSRASLVTIAAVSRFHGHNNDQLNNFLKRNNIMQVQSIGSAIKLGRLALGEIDVYPRFVGSKEWDIAAGHIILKKAGGRILDLKSNKEPLYNKQDVKNNNFIACRYSIDDLILI